MQGCVVRIFFQEVHHHKSGVLFHLGEEGERVVDMFDNVER